MVAGSRCASAARSRLAASSRGASIRIDARCRRIARAAEDRSGPGIGCWSSRRRGRSVDIQTAGLCAQARLPSGSRPPNVIPKPTEAVEVMPDHHPASRGVKLLAILTLAQAVAFSVALLFAPRWAATAMMTDDAYYYLKIAQNIIDGAGATFDGFEATNGFHPLWMLLVCGLVSICGSGGAFAVSALLLLNSAIAFTSVWVAFRIVRDRLAPGFEWCAVGLFLLPNVWLGLTNGMETGLLSLLVLVFVHQVVFHDALDPSKSAGPTCRLGALLGCILLARLDSAFVLLAVGVVTILICVVERLPFAVLFRRSFWLGGSALLVSAPYFWWNVSTFGSPMPISGAVKSTMPCVREELALHTDLGVGVVIVMAVVVATLVLLVVGLRRGATAGQWLRSPFPVIALGATLHLIHAWLFLDWGVYWWHFAAAAILLPVIVPAVLGVLVGRDRERIRRWLYAGAVGVAAASLLVLVLVTRNKSERHLGWLEAAEWAKSSTPADAAFALKDAGLFSYFAERQVVNLDGKASGVGYLAAMESGTVIDYLKARDIAFLADIESTYHEGFDTIYLPRAGVPGLLLRVPDRLEVYRSSPAPLRAFGAASHEGIASFVIWRFDASAITVR